MPVQVQDIIPADAAQEEEEEAPPQEEAQEATPQEEAPPAPKRRGRPPREQERAEAAIGGSAGHRRGAKGEAEAEGEATRGARAHEARRQQESGDTGGFGERGFRGRTSSKPGRAEEGPVGPVSARAGGGPPSEDRALHQSAGQGAGLLTDLVPDSLL